MDIFEAEVARRFVVAVEKIANALDRKTEPTISKMEQVEEPQKWTKENCKGCKYNEYPYDSGTCFVRVCINGNKYEPKDEPQTDIHDLTDCDFCKDRNCKDCEGGKDEPQTDCAWK